MCFQIDRAMKYPSTESCFRVDVLEECLTDLIEDYFLERIHESMNKYAEFLSEVQVETNKSESVYEADVKTADLGEPRRDPHQSHASRVPWDEDLETGGSESDETDAGSARELSAPDATRVKTQTKRPTPELKPLLANLRYEFLGPDHSFPVIVNADLNPDQIAKLLEKLKLHQGAIGYSINNLKGISPSICLHRIFLEEDHKPSVEHQRRLNPNLKEVVKK